MTGTLWWDFDGTLVSRPTMWTEAGHRFLSQAVPDARIQREHLDGRFSTGFPWHRPDLSHTDLATSDEWWNCVYEKYRQVFSELGHPNLTPPFDGIRRHILDSNGYTVFDDVVPVLDRLSGNGWRHLIVSNHVPELVQIVDGLGLAHFFDGVLTSGTIGFEKPHRRMFEAARACSRADGPVWMIGDNPRADCEGATACGVDAVLVRNKSEFRRRADDLWGVVRMLENR
jgi:putative hydrolase of the HAD superfamily